MKAVLSNRIYLECTPEYKKFMDEELTYSIPSYNPTDPPHVIKNLGQIRDNLVTIPIGRTDLIPEDYEVVDKRVVLPVEFPEFRGTLRDSQSIVYDAVEDNCIINAKPSWGKTFTGLKIASKLGQKCLVVVHTVPLRTQWVRETKKVFGFEPGIIGSGEFDISKPVTVGNIQTLYRNVAKVKKEFGTLILDEMHHVSAPTFSRIIDASFARYKIGLSGTIIRKDGKHVVFRDYFGSTVYKPPKENSMTPSVDVVKTDVRFMDGRMPWASRINDLVSNEEYQHLIAMLAAGYAAKGHRVLVLSNRILFLKKCANLVGDKAVCVIGDVDHDQREVLIQQVRSGEKEILFGNQSIFSEGISIDPLSCLILANPINNDPLLEQLVGRIQREYPNKLPPKIVDIHLRGRTATRQASNRIGFYMREGYKIKQL